MYTYKQAVKDSRKYLESEYASHLLTTVGKRKLIPSYREIINAIDECYRLYMKRLLFRGDLFKAYKERKSLSDILFIPEILGDKLIPSLVLFFFCEDYMNDDLEDLRNLILELVNLSWTYIESEEIPVKNYNEIKELEI